MAKGKANYFCESCGTQVDKWDVQCPNCGKQFDSIKCPQCGYSGNAQEFSNGCPSCGFMSEEQKLAAAQKSAAAGGRKSNINFSMPSSKAISTGGRIFLIIFLLGVLGGLLYWLSWLAQQP